MKKFFSAFLLMTAMVLSVGTFVACNDLTEEMETVQTQATSNAAAIKALGDQITALQQALATAQSTADAAKAAGEEAKAAAAQAKADAIKEAKAECETLKAALEAKINENADAIVKLTALVNTKIEAIDAELAKMATIAKVDEAVANLTKTDTDLKVQIEAIKKYAADSLVTIKMAEDMRAELLAADATLGKALQDSIAEVMAYAEELEETITNGIEGLQEKVDAVTARVEKLEAAVTKMDANLKTLTTFAYTSLRSLVFVPDFYYGGIEATEYTYMEYLTKAGDATKWNDAAHAGKVDDRGVTVKIISAEKEWNYKTVVDKKGVEVVNFKNPVKYVSYWMNPSNADIAGADLAFISKDVLSKASKVAPQVAGDYQVVAMKDDEGKVRNAVKVPMVVDGKYLNANENPADTARVFALSAGIQANAKDTTIVSDYARLQSSELQLEGLAYTKVTDAAACAAQKTNHLYTNAYDALKAVPTLAVKYDGSIDLRKQIETHYTINGTDVASYEKNYMAEGTPAYEYNPYGLKWNFALIDYVTGNNKTSDTKH
ncbi:MAG: hypothetical protein J6S01_02380, partial [Bacteroidales bacterium]|nr:hypothetical protein [Bacteroidales bacterium]